MGPDIVSSIYQHGIAPTAALICTSLYIQQMIREKSQSKTDEFNAKTETERHHKTNELINKVLDNQSTLLDQVKILMSNTVSLAELSRNLQADNHNIVSLTNTLITDVKLLASNQNTLMMGFQKVIEQLIAALRD